jgi:hypothetical protein
LSEGRNAPARGATEATFRKSLRVIILRLMVSKPP